MKPNSERPLVMQVLLSFRYAFAGVGVLARDRNMIVHVLAAAVAIVLATWLRLSAVEWAVLVLTIALVISVEAINSAIEFVVDLASPEIHPLAARAKNVSAAAVLIAAMSALIVGAILFLPKLISS
jgi:diacylglycerol kinase